MKRAASNTKPASDPTFTDEDGILLTGKPPKPEQLSGKERFEHAFPHVIAINRDEDALFALRNSLIDGKANAIARNTLEKADNNIERVRAVEHPKAAPEIEAKCAKRAAALDAERAAIESEFEMRMATTPGPARNFLTDFYRSSESFAKYERANTPTDFREGESPLDSNTRLIAEWRALLAEEKVVMAAPLPAADITDNAYALVGRIAATAATDQLIGSLRRVSPDAHRGFKRRTPTVDKADTLGLIATLMGDDLAGALAARALEGHDESKALDDLARSEKLTAIRSRRLAIEYVTEANHRYARKRGENSGQRITSNPLCILDLREA